MMKAYRILRQKTIEPFRDSPLDVPILNEKLGAIQRAHLKEAGVEIVEHPPVGEPYLLISDAIWFTAELVRLFLKECRDLRPGQRLYCDHDGWKDLMEPLQSVEQGYDLAYVEGEPSFENTELIAFDWGLTKTEPNVHITMRDATKVLWGGPAVAHHIEHWSHILRVNQLAIANRAHQVQLLWKRSGIFGKMGMVFSFLWRVRSINKETVLKRIGSIDKSAKIHPTAVIEACDIGAGVEIGPYAVLRGSVIGDGVKIEEHATVNLSVVGKGAQIGRYATANLCLLYEESLISHGGGLQGCLFGRRSFGAIGVQILDLSFGKNVKVQKDGKWVDSGQRFLGAAVGHEAVLGNAVRVNYGVAIPNKTTIVASTDDLVRNTDIALRETEHEQQIFKLEAGELKSLVRRQRSLKE
ncbi:MAG: hypothetical protein CMK59_10025 [Proteobacteria bacterium]|nr:hypothetical protein [Pseudomonadota bacterium]